LAAERPQGGLELQFTWRRPSGITQLKGIRLLYSYYNFNMKTSLQTSVADPYVFGLPGSASGYINQRYGSGSFYHKAKILGKTLIPIV
jgi:hypothetical protein